MKREQRFENAGLVHWSDAAKAKECWQPLEAGKVKEQVLF